MQQVQPSRGHSRSGAIGIALRERWPPPKTPCTGPTGAGEPWSRAFQGSGYQGRPALSTPNVAQCMAGGCRDTSPLLGASPRLARDVSGGRHTAPPRHASRRACPAWLAAWWWLRPYHRQKTSGRSPGARGWAARTPGGHRPREVTNKASAHGAGDCRFESCRGCIASEVIGGIGRWRHRIDRRGIQPASVC